MHVLVTGAAGFIGHNVSRRLLAMGHRVTGVDALTDYYDVELKRRRLAELEPHVAFGFHEMNVEDAAALWSLFEGARPSHCIHLAAQAGVRYSLENPSAYVGTNVVGSFNVIDACRRAGVEHLVLASTSSAYGANRDVPFRESDPAEHPLTIYAATKRASELIAHSQSHLHGLPVTAVRFFTVYGEWSRPDMAPWLFADAILKGEPIRVFNGGDMQRDFTFVDDLAEAMLRLLGTPPEVGSPVGEHDTLSPVAPYRLVNIGNAAPVALPDFIAELELALGREAVRDPQPMQPGDMQRTFADTRLLHDLTDYRPDTPIREGVERFSSWFKSYMKS